jgi:O-antigen/teichoic acid export membrane protein
LVSSLLTTALSGVGLTVFTLRSLKLRFSVGKFVELSRFGTPLVVTSFASFALNFSDRFFLQHFTNVSAVGIYALGYKFGFMLTFLAVQPFDMIWSSRVYEVAKKSNGPKLFSRIFRYYMLVLIALALGLSLFIQDAISVVAAPSFRAAYKVVPVVALAYVFQGAYRFMVGGIYVKKATHWVGAISAVSLSLNLVLNYLLIRPYAGMGAAWATVISFFVMAGLAYIVSQRLYPVPYSVGSFLAAVVVALILYLGAVMLPISSIIWSIVVKVLVLVSFPVVLYLTGYFEKSEVERALQTAQSFWATRRWGPVGSSQ